MMFEFIGAVAASVVGGVLLAAIIIGVLTFYEIKKDFCQKIIRFLEHIGLILIGFILLGTVLSLIAGILYGLWLLISVVFSIS